MCCRQNNITSFKLLDKNRFNDAKTYYSNKYKVNYTMGSIEGCESNKSAYNTMGKKTFIEHRREK